MTRNSIRVSCPVGIRIGSSMAFVMIVCEDPSRSRSRSGVIGYDRRLCLSRKWVSMKHRSAPQSRRESKGELRSGGAVTGTTKEGAERADAFNFTSNKAQLSSTQPSSCAESRGLLRLFSIWRDLRHRRFARCELSRLSRRIWGNPSHCVRIGRKTCKAYRGTGVAVPRS